MQKNYTLGVPVDAREAEQAVEVVRVEDLDPNGLEIMALWAEQRNQHGTLQRTIGSNEARHRDMAQMLKWAEDKKRRILEVKQQQLIRRRKSMQRRMDIDESERDLAVSARSVDGFMGRGRGYPDDSEADTSRVALERTPSEPTDPDDIVPDFLFSDDLVRAIVHETFAHCSQQGDLGEGSNFAHQLSRECVNQLQKMEEPCKFIVNVAMLPASGGVSMRSGCLWSPGKDGSLTFQFRLSLWLVVVTVFMFELDEQSLLARAHHSPSHARRQASGGPSRGRSRPLRGARGGRGGLAPARGGRGRPAPARGGRKK